MAPIETSPVTAKMKNGALQACSREGEDRQQHADDELRPAAPAAGITLARAQACA